MFYNFKFLMVIEYQNINGFEILLILMYIVIKMIVKQSLIALIHSLEIIDDCSNWNF